MELAMELWWRAGALQALATLLEVAVLGGLLGKQRMEQQVGGAVPVTLEGTVRVMSERESPCHGVGCKARHAICSQLHSV